MNILIIKHGAIGDFVMSIGAMKSIRNKFPKNNIYLLTTTSINKVFFKIPYVDQVLIDDRKSILDLFRYLIKLKKFEITLVIDLQNSKRTEIYHLFTKFISKNIKINSSRKFANYTYKILPHGHEHVSDGLNNQLKLIKINKFFKPNVDWLKNKNFKNPLPKKFVVLIPGSSKSGIKKRWPTKSFSELSNIFIKEHYDVIATGSYADQPIIDEIISYNPKIKKSEKLSKFNNFINLCNDSSLIVSVDTGPAHIAALSNKPFIWLVEKGPYNLTNIPLSDNIYTLKADKMKNISVEEVVQVSKKILSIR